MSVKEKILEAALRLYNESGVNAITTRHIAKDLGMSPGNLHYHFRYTGDVIEALFDEFVSEFELHMASFTREQVVDMAYLFELNSACFDIIYKYRFGFINTGDIGYLVPRIREKNNILRAKRSAQLDVLIDQLVQSGHLRHDIPDVIWDAFKKQLFIFTDSYLSYNQAAQQRSQKFAKAEFLMLYESLFFTYLARP